MQTYTSRSNTRPPEWDLTSSPTTAYHNYNIKELQDESGLCFEYTVDKMTLQECNVFLLGKIAELESVKDDLNVTNAAVLELMDREATANANV